jgi:hypothetical protein
MAEDGGKDPLRIRAGQGEIVGVAEAGGLDLHQHLARAGAFEVDLGDLERLAGLDGQCGAGLHGASPSTNSDLPLLGGVVGIV